MACVISENVAFAALLHISVSAICVAHSNRHASGSSDQALRHIGNGGSGGSGAILNAIARASTRRGIMTSGM